eukprot:TRINITY_DN1529_c0_g1_i3.p1 TRINITY_DN1529_c0_g1~~TRINITY_DN1529_c0_g1_i3.p1  ORF type:complete len:178 (+),score=78.73 TRINITY_DN1529_c0_g1_i3:291-824(+)
MEITHEITNQYGLNIYECSNYAKPGHECKHNLHYWESGDYIGIGPGAAGRLTFEHDQSNSTWRESFLQIKQPHKWIESVTKNNTGILNHQILSQKERLEEVLLMGLRTINGISRETWIHHSNGKTFEQILNNQKQSNSDFEQLIKLNLIEIDEKGLRATKQGIFLLDAILPKLHIEI